MQIRSDFVDAAVRISQQTCCNLDLFLSNVLRYGQASLSFKAAGEMLSTYSHLLGQNGKRRLVKQMIVNEFL